MSSKAKLPAYMLPLGEIVKTSTKVLMGTSGHVFGLMAIMIAYTAIMVIIYGILAYSAKFFSLDVSYLGTTLTFSTLGIVTSVVFGLILGLGTSYLMLMMIRSIHAQYEGKPMTFGAAFDAAKHRFVPFILATLLALLITTSPTIVGQILMTYQPLIGLIIYLPASIIISILSIYLSVTQYTAALEGTSAVNSLKASWWVIRGRWWTVVGYTITLTILMAVLMIPFFVPLAIFKHWAAGIPMIIVAILLSGFYLVFLQIFYYRLRDTAAKKPAEFLTATPAPATPPVTPATPAAN